MPYSLHLGLDKESKKEFNDASKSLIATVNDKLYSRFRKYRNLKAYKRQALDIVESAETLTNIAYQSTFESASEALSKLNKLLDTAVKHKFLKYCIEKHLFEPINFTHAIYTKTADEILGILELKTAPNEDKKDAIASEIKRLGITIDKNVLALDSDELEDYADVVMNSPLITLYDKYKNNFKIALDDAQNQAQKPASRLYR